MEGEKRFLRRLMQEFADAGHSIFAPSGSAMWLSCPGSLIANLLEEDSGSWEAAEGTVAHELAESWLRTGVKPSDRIGETVIIQEKPEAPAFSVTIDEIMLDWVEDYVNWCAVLPGDHYIEQKVWFTDLMPVADPEALEGEYLPFVPQGGTADHAACYRGHLVISDLKYGKGVYVETHGNTQARLYALGFFNEWDWLYDFQKITVRIGQPRLHNWGEWTITREELLAFGEEVRAAAAEAWQIDAPRRVSRKACQWCKVKPDCAAFAVAIDALVYAELDALGLAVSAEAMTMMKARLREEYRMYTAETSRLSHEEMVQILAYRKPVESFFQKLDEHLTREALDGTAIRGKKLSAGRSFRQWHDPKAAAEHMLFLGLPEEEIYTVEVISPAQMEEKLRKVTKYDRKVIPRLIQKQVYSPPGKPTLVDDNDPRPALSHSDEGVWDD